MFRNVLVAFDGSDPARKALDVALDMAQKHQSEIHVVAVGRPPEIAEEVETRASSKMRANIWNAPIRRTEK